MTRYLMQQLMRLADERDEPTARSRFSFSIGRAPMVFCVHADMFAIVERRHASLLAGVQLTRIETRKRRFVLFPILENRRAHEVYTCLRLLSKSERRRHRVATATGHHLKEHYRVLWEVQRGQCYYSGAPLGARFEDRKFCVDHIAPLCPRPIIGGVPGTNWPTNLALTTKRVNDLKGGDPVRFFLREARRLRWFEPTSYRERCRIDRERQKAFSNFLIKHSSQP